MSGSTCVSKVGDDCSLSISSMKIVLGKPYKNARSNNYHSANAVKSAAPAGENDSPPVSPSSSLAPLRRERTEPSLDRENKTTVPEERNESFSDGHLLRSQSGKNLASNRYANKQVAPSSLLTVESLPIRPLTRSKVADRQGRLIHLFVIFALNERTNA
jgi:hypothetical protein